MARRPCLFTPVIAPRCVKRERDDPCSFSLSPPFSLLPLVCVVVNIYPVHYNGHHVAGCFAVDWMKLIKLKGRGGEKREPRWWGSRAPATAPRVGTCLMFVDRTSAPVHRVSSTLCHGRKLVGHLLGELFTWRRVVETSNRRRLRAHLHAWLYVIRSLTLLPRINTKMVANFCRIYLYVRLVWLNYTFIRMSESIIIARVILFGYNMRACVSHDNAHSLFIITKSTGN